MIRNKFRAAIGIVSFMAYPEIGSGKGPIDQSIKKIALDPFFSLIEISHIEDKDTRTEVSKILKTSNIRVSFGAHPAIFGGKLNINSDNDEIRNESVDILKELIDEAYQMDAESFVFVSGQRSEEASLESQLELIKLSIDKLCRYNLKIANDFGKDPMDMILETFDQKPFAKNRLIGPTDIAVELTRNIKEKFNDFGLLLDLSHLPILGEDYKDSLVKAKEYIKHIHIGNCILKDREHAAYGDEHPRFCIDKGEIFTSELAGFIRVLDKIGYLSNPKNTISFEVKPLIGEDPDITIAGSKRVLLKAIEKIY